LESNWGSNSATHISLIWINDCDGKVKCQWTPLFYQRWASSVELARERA